MDRTAARSACRSRSPPPTAPWWCAPGSFRSPPVACRPGGLRSLDRHGVVAGSRGVSILLDGGPMARDTVVPGADTTRPQCRSAPDHRGASPNFHQLNRLHGRRVRPLARRRAPSARQDRRHRETTGRLLFRRCGQNFCRLRVPGRESLRRQSCHRPAATQSHA